MLVLKGTAGGIGRADVVVGREDIGGIARRHNSECIVADVNAVGGDAGERVWHGRVPIVLVDEGDSIDNFAACCTRGGGIRGQPMGVVGGAGVARCKSDEFVAYAGGQAFKKIGDAQAEVNVVDNAGAKGFNGSIE